MINLKKLHPKVRSRIYKERLETMPEEYIAFDKDKKLCYIDNKMNNMKVKDLKPILPADKLLKNLLDTTQTVEPDPNLCPDCQSMTHEYVELREGNYMEILRECFGCGSLQT